MACGNIDKKLSIATSKRLYFAISYYKVRSVEKIQTTSVSNFRNNYNEVLSQVNDGPVLLLQSSQVAAVLLAPEKWNQIADRLKKLQHLELLAEAKRRSAEMDSDPSAVVTHEELKKAIAEKAQRIDVDTSL